MNFKEEKKQKGVLTTAYTDFNKGMNGYSFFKVNDHSLSDDLVQDTFIKTWNYLVRGGKIIMMKSFLYHVLNGLIIDEYRKKKPMSLDTIIENGYEPSDPESQIKMDIFDGKIAVLLMEKLPQKYKGVMKMKFIQGLTLKEMSLISGQTKNTVAVQIHRGIQMLKDLYDHKPIVKK